MRASADRTALFLRREPVGSPRGGVPRYDLDLVPELRVLALDLISEEPRPP